MPRPMNNTFSWVYNLFAIALYISLELIKSSARVSIFSTSLLNVSITESSSNPFCFIIVRATFVNVATCEEYPLVVATAISGPA